MFDDYYANLTKKEKRSLRKKEREAELAAIRRNKILRRIFFWTVFTLLVLTGGFLLIKVANQSPYKHNLTAN